MKHITSDNARELQAKSVEARKKNNSAMEVLREELQHKVGDLTKLEYLTKKALDNASRDMTLKDILTIQQILGEHETKVNVSGDINANVGLTHDEAYEKIKEMLGL